MIVFSIPARRPRIEFDVSGSTPPFIRKSGRCDQAVHDGQGGGTMVERMFLYLRLRFRNAAEETPDINRLGRTTASPVPHSGRGMPRSSHVDKCAFTRLI